MLSEVKTLQLKLESLEKDQQDYLSIKDRNVLLQKEVRM